MRGRPNARSSHSIPRIFAGSCRSFGLRVRSGIRFDALPQGDQALFGISQVIAIGIFEPGIEDRWQLRQGFGSENHDPVGELIDSAIRPPRAYNRRANKETPLKRARKQFQDTLGSIDRNNSSWNSVIGSRCNMLVK